MTPIERVQAAIDKLTELKAVSTRGPWHEWTNDLTDRVELWHDQEVRRWVADVGDDEPGAHADAELIVTLHRTVDAQLAILNDGLIVAKHWEDILDKLSGTMRTPLDHALLIADAILGAVS